MSIAYSIQLALSFPKSNIFVYILAGILLGFVLIETSLRLVLGLGKELLYIKDEKIGYLLAPQQKVRRFGKLTQINQYSLRNGEINPQRPDKTLRILLLGDSIVNGGWWSDQQETISALLEGNLSKYNNLSYSQIEVLNAAANSWGPRNQLAYLEKFGTFESQIVILLINTDDFYTVAPNPDLVGQDKNYPDHQPLGAIAELWQRIVPQSQKLKKPRETGDIVGLNLEAIAQIKLISEKNQAKLILGITPLQRETIPPGSRNHELKARQRLLTLVETEAITFIDFLAYFQENQAPSSLYRDHIHLSKQGNQLVVNKINQLLEQEYFKDRN